METNTKKTTETTVETNVVYEHIRELAKLYPNDADYGRKVRTYLIKLGLYEK